MTVDIATLAAQTPPGMAAIMATGPAGETCRTCGFWGGNATELEHGTLSPSTVYRRWDHGQPLRQACWRYRQIRRSQLMDEERSRRVEAATPACSHWRRAEIEPQPERRPEPVGG